MFKTSIFLLALLSNCIYGNANTVEYQVIPLSEAGDEFDLTENRPMQTNSLGQTIGFFHDPDAYGYWNFYDPIRKKKIKLPPDPKFITENGYVAGYQQNCAYVWNYKTRHTDQATINPV